VIEDEFEKLRNTFFEKYCDVFEETEENKLIYTNIFKEYINKLETYIENVIIIIQACRIFKKELRNIKFKSFINYSRIEKKK
jgi:hypothetical protein